MKKNKLIKVLIIIMIVILSTGCTKTLVNSEKKAVKNEITGQNLTKNILCQPTNETTIKAYKENSVDIYQNVLTLK